MGYKNLAFFAGGLGIGGIVGYFLAKRKFDAELQELGESDDIFEDEESEEYEEEEDEDEEEPIVMRSSNETVRINEDRKAEMAKSIFGDPEEILKDLVGQLTKAKEEAAEPVSVSWKSNTKKPESISPEQFFYDDGSIVKAADPLIYFEGDGNLINTEDDICEPFSEEFLNEYFNIEETVEHFGDWEDPNILYLRCYEEPVTDYRIIRKEGTFEESPWYPGPGVKK